MASTEGKFDPVHVLNDNDPILRTLPIAFHRHNVSIIPIKEYNFDHWLYYENIIV